MAPPLGSLHPHGQAARWLREWSALLDGPLERVLEVLTSSTQYAREMRQNSPFAGVMSDVERKHILTQFREHDLSRRQRR